MMKKFQYILFILFVLMSGCSKEEDKATANTSSNEPILKDQMRALEKAKGVEKMLQEQVDMRHQAMEEQSK